MSIPDEKIDLLRTMLYQRGYTSDVVKSLKMKLAIGFILREMDRGMDTPPLISSLIDEYLTSQFPLNSDRRTG